MRNGRVLIDFHVHLAQYDMLLDSPKEWFISMYPSKEDYEKICADYSSPDTFCALMKENGVDYAVILAENAPEVSGIASNKTVLDFCKGHPELIPFCTFDPLREKDMEKQLPLLVEQGFKGVKLYPTYNFFYPNDPMMYPLYEKAQELDLPVMFHTGTSIFKGSRLKYGNPIFWDDLAIDFPSLRMILCHGGRGPWYEEAMTMARLHKNIYIDITGLPPKKLPQFFSGMDRMPEKFVFGTDWPSVNIGKNADAVANLSMSEDAVRKILGENALELLGLKK